MKLANYSMENQKFVILLNKSSYEFIDIQKEVMPWEY